MSKHPVNSLTVAQAVAEHEQLLGQLKVKLCPFSACYHASALARCPECPWATLLQRSIASVLQMYGNASFGHTACTWCP